ncbi:MAG: ribosome silencing factor, partial [Deltaproteobacteria bacterium]|nr:ribosome silencing factor [Deltaproteobacteria bacterium]
ICSSRSEKHSQGILYRLLKELDGYIEPRAVEGQKEGKWIVIDFDDIIVHIFSKPMREFYKLEDIWYSAKTVNYHKLLGLKKAANSR